MLGVPHHLEASQTPPVSHNRRKGTIAMMHTQSIEGQPLVDWTQAFLDDSDEWRDLVE